VQVSERYSNEQWKLVKEILTYNPVPELQSEWVSEWQNIIIKLSTKWYLNMVQKFQQDAWKYYRIIPKYYRIIYTENT